MKIKLLIALTILFANFGFSQTVSSEEDCNVGDAYFAKIKVYIYEGMNTNSTIMTEVQIGEQVVVLNTFFGDHGWWKICYKGITGNARKELLSDKEFTIASSTTSEISIDNHEVGFNPFVARASTTLNFRSEPSFSSNKIKSILVGSNVFVYSNNPVNDYYKSIDVMTGQIGWIHKNYIVHFQDIELNQKGAFLDRGYTASEYPEVSIENKSSQITRLIIGKEIFSINPNETKSIKLKPGRLHYIAITPGAIPTAGFQLFEANNEYKWEF